MTVLLEPWRALRELLASAFVRLGWTIGASPLQVVIRDGRSTHVSRTRDGEIVAVERRVP